MCIFGANRWTLSPLAWALWHFFSSYQKYEWLVPLQENIMNKIPYRGAYIDIPKSTLHSQKGTHGLCLLTCELGGEVRDERCEHVLTHVHASSGSLTRLVARPVAYLPQDTYDLPQCCSRPSGGWLCQVNFVTIKALDKLCALGHFGLKTQNVFFPGGDYVLKLRGKHALEKS